MKTFFRWAAVAAIVGLSGTGFGQVVAHSPEEFLVQWGAAWNAHDVDAIMRMHAEDCVTVNRFGTLARNKAATYVQMTHLHATVFKGMSFPTPKLLLARTVAPGLIEIQASWQNPQIRPATPGAVDDMVFSMLLKDSGKDGLLAEDVDLHNVDPAMQGPPPGMAK